VRQNAFSLCGSTQNLRRAAYAQRSVFREWLIKTDDTGFAYDGRQLFSNHEIRRQKRQLLMNVAGTETQHQIADVERVADIAMDALEPWLVTGSTMTAFQDFIDNR